MDERFAAVDAALKAGRKAEAVDRLIIILTETPEAPLQIYRSLLINMWQLGRYEEGAAWTPKALAIAPKDFDLLNLYGVFLRRTHRFPEAIKALEQAQRLRPKELTPLVNMGNIHNDMKNGPAAEAVFGKLVRLQPRMAEYQRGLGRALWNQNKHGPAALRFRQAVTLKKDYVDAWLDLSGVENDRLNHAQSLEILDRACEAVPGEPRLLEAKVRSLRHAGRLRDAEQFLLSLLPEADNQGWLHHQLARSISDFDRDRANIHFRRAIELEPENIEYRIALAESLERTRTGFEGANIDEAYQTLLGVTGLDVLDPVHNKIATEILIRVGDYDAADALGSFTDLGRGWATTGRHTALLKHLARARSHEDRLELVHQHRLWGDQTLERAKRSPIVRPAGPKPTSKIRIGFMSSDLRNHPVAYFALPLFEHADRERFEIFCYSFYQGKADGTQAHIASLTDGFRWNPDISDREAAQLIADDQLDMLFELGGSTHMNKIEVMAYKPARLLASWLGYPHSAGLTTIDYLLVDPYLNPPRPELLIEDPLIMPRSWIALGRLAFPDAHVINPVAPVKRNGFITFGTANNPYKYSPEMLQTWAEVVAATPGSRFLFVRPEGGSEAFRTNLRAIFAAAGVPGDRILFNAVRGAHMPIYNEIDIALDTFPQTGGTTTCEAAWMGVPTVSQVGEAIFERLSYSILNNAGLGDLCASTPEAFVETAVNLAADHERIQALRTGLRDQLKASPLGQTEQFAKDFYALIADTVEKRLGVRKSA